MKRIFILLFMSVALISTVFITGCNDSGGVSKFRKVAVKLVPMGEKAANKYLDKLVTDDKITKYQKDKIIQLYLKIKAKAKKDKTDNVKGAALDGDTASVVPSEPG